MMLLVILLLFSVALNIALTFGIVKRRAEEDITVIKLRDGYRIE